MSDTEFTSHTYRGVDYIRDAQGYLIHDGAGGYKDLGPDWDRAKEAIDELIVSGNLPG